MAQDRLTFAIGQIEAGHFGVGQSDLFIPFIGGDVLDLSAVTFAVEDDDDARDVSRSEAGEELRLVLGNESRGARFPQGVSRHERVHVDGGLY